MSIQALGRDLLLIVFSYLGDERDLSCCQRVCKFWKRIASKECLWERFNQLNEAVAQRGLFFLARPMGTFSLVSHWSESREDGRISRFWVGKFGESKPGGEYYECHAPRRTLVRVDEQGRHPIAVRPKRAFFSGKSFGICPVWSPYYELIGIGRSSFHRYLIDIYLFEKNGLKGGDIRITGFKGASAVIGSIKSGWLPISSGRCLVMGGSSVARAVVANPNVWQLSRRSEPMLLSTRWVTQLTFAVPEPYGHFTPLRRLTSTEQASLHMRTANFSQGVHAGLWNGLQASVCLSKEDGYPYLYHRHGQKGAFSIRLNYPHFSATTFLQSWRLSEQGMFVAVSADKLQGAKITPGKPLEIFELDLPKGTSEVIPNSQGTGFFIKIGEHFYETSLVKGPPFDKKPATKRPLTRSLSESKLFALASQGKAKKPRKE